MDDSGIEPLTLRTSSECSPAELIVHQNKIIYENLDTPMQTTSYKQYLIYNNCYIE